MMNLTEDADTVMRLEPQLDEGLSHGNDVPLVLGVGPLHPDPVPLDSQRGLVRNSVHRLLDHPPERFGRNVGILAPLSFSDCVIESDFNRDIWSCRNKLNISAHRLENTFHNLESQPFQPEEFYQDQEC